MSRGAAGWGGGGKGYAPQGGGAAGQSSGGNRWSRGGAGAGAKGGRGGKGGKTPWSFFHVCDEGDTLGLAQLAKQIPDDWVDYRHGGRRQPQRMHSTLLLKMTGPAHLARLERLVQAAEPISVSVRELFCQRVDRITDAEVYCIGVALASPELRALKDAWVAEEAPEQRKEHVPYDTEGHISLVYIRGDRRQDAEAFVAQHAGALSDGRTFTLDHVTYQDEWGKESAISFAGGPATTEDSQRASKGARHSGPAVSKGPMQIDGSVLEGGGQILRMSSSYSAIFGVPIHISKIRAGRSKPGLAAQHLESLRLVRDVSAGSLSNDFVGSCEVDLVPSGLAAGSFTADPGTAGAITLMVQASIFPLLLAGGDSVCDLRGGTDVAFSPPLDFLQRVLQPMARRMGASFEVTCKRRGFFPRGGGAVQLDVQRLAEPLQAIDLSERGKPARVTAVFHATKPLEREQPATLKAVKQSLAHLAPQVHVEFSQDPPPDGRTAKYWLDVVVETTTGALFHGGAEPKDFPGTGKHGGGKGKSLSLPDLAERAASEAAKPLEEQLASGAAVDVHLCDQLILPASLAAGKSQLLVSEMSLHAQTAIHIAELMVPGVKFTRHPRGKLSLVEVEGIGYMPGQGAAASAGGFQGSPAQPAAEAAPRAAPPRAAAPPALREEVVPVAKGSLSQGARAMLQEFRNDIGIFSERHNIEVVIDKSADRLLLRGDVQDPHSCRQELNEVLGYYQLLA